jgi:FtsP/CotA-like multicopper oxidase with cupredoxin domain
MSALAESQVSRRDFLKGSGALVVAFGVPSLRTAAATAATGRAGAIGPALVDPDQTPGSRSAGTAASRSWSARSSSAPD